MSGVSDPATGRPSGSCSHPLSRPAGQTEHEVEEKNLPCDDAQFVSRFAEKGGKSRGTPVKRSSLVERGVRAIWNRFDQATRLRFAEPDPFLTISGILCPAVFGPSRWA
jgi:hypothetical protein